MTTGHAVTTVTVGVTEFRSHRPGTEQTVCKKETFVIFVEDYPSGTDIGENST